MNPANTATKPKHGDAFSLVFLAVSTFFIGLEIYAITTTSHYRFDIPMCMLLLYMCYRLREQLHLVPGDFVLTAVFLMMHSLGIFDLYTRFPLGIEYDYWVHGLFGVVAALIAMQFLQSVMPYSAFALSIATVILVMGIAAFHELYEFAGAIWLGEGEGVLFIGAGDLDQWDTHKKTVK